MYQELLDNYYVDKFDLATQSKWKSNHKKLRQVVSDQDIGSTLKQMWVWFSEVRVEEFYEPEIQKWWTITKNRQNKEVNYIKEWNIIQELLIYIQQNKISFNSSEIILNRKCTSMYIYIKWVDKTVIISNIYWVGTHVYQWKIDTQEMQNSTIGILCKKHNGKKINFGLDFWWMEWWKSRFIKTLIEKNNGVQKNEIESQEEKILFTEKSSTEKYFTSLRDKIEYFSKDKENITHKELSFDQNYEWIITKISPKDNRIGWRIYINIWHNIFGYFIYRGNEEIRNIELWGIVKVKAQRVWKEGDPILFKRPE